MIKALRIDHDVASKSEFAALVEFLDLLGFQNEMAGPDQKPNARSTTFSAPLGKISFGWESQAHQRLEAEAWAFSVEVDDPDTAFELIQKKGYEILSDNSEYKTGGRHFVVAVTSALRIAVFGFPDHWLMKDRADGLRASGMRVAIVVARFNAFITERLLQGALDGLVRLGARQDDIAIVRVPGAFEIPAAARTLAETKKYDAVICIGCLLRGDTAHYDVIVNEVARGIGQSAQETGVPHAFGVLTCDTLEQAIDRAGLKMGNKGFEAALAAVEMVNLSRDIQSSKQKAKAGKRKIKTGKLETRASKTKTKPASRKRR